MHVSDVINELELAPLFDQLAELPVVELKELSARFNPSPKLFHACEIQETPLMSAFFELRK